MNENSISVKQFTSILHAGLRYTKQIMKIILLYINSNINLRIEFIDNRCEIDFGLQNDSVQDLFLYIS